MALTLSVAKWQGTGNDFIVLDNRANTVLSYADLARRLCDRRFGIGADGLLVVLPAARADADAAMRLFNADGSEAQMCGNGIRCVAKHLSGDGRGALTIETPAGIITSMPVHRGGVTQVRVDLGRPKFERGSIPMTGPPPDIVMDEPFQVRGLRFSMCAVSMGNPHCVLFTEQNPEQIDIHQIAAAVLRRGAFPQGVNVEVARVHPKLIAVRVFERGVGETWACGTGACAVAVSAIKTGRARSPVTILARGGSVEVEWNAPDAAALLTGPAERVFTAEIEI